MGTNGPPQRSDLPIAGRTSSAGGGAPAVPQWVTLSGRSHCCGARPWDLRKTERTRHTPVLLETMTEQGALRTT